MEEQFAIIATFHVQYFSKRLSEALLIYQTVDKTFFTMKKLFASYADA
jgi:hypothetical protein